MLKCYTYLQSGREKKKERRRENEDIFNQNLWREVTQNFYYSVHLVAFGEWKLWNFIKIIYIMFCLQLFTNQMVLLCILHGIHMSTTTKTVSHCCDHPFSFLLWILFSSPFAITRLLSAKYTTTLHALTNLIYFYRNYKWFVYFSLLFFCLFSKYLLQRDVQIVTLCLLFYFILFNSICCS